jgi:membrane fusion protein (multidrug efflux system)
LEEIEAKEAEISRLKTQEQYLEQQLKSLVVTSPISGVVTTRHLKEKIGQSLKKGEVIAVVQQIETLNAEIMVPEQEIANVKTGQRVILRVRAYPGAKLVGAINGIAEIADKEGDPAGRRIFLVTTKISNEDQLLKPEMSGQAKIYCGKQHLIDVTTRRLARYLRVEVWSWW